MISLLVCAKSISMYDLNSFSANSLAIVLFPIRFAPLISNEYLSDYSLVIAPVVADLCTTPVALSAPPNSYQNNSQS